jgi:uncharacterized membrane protein
VAIAYPDQATADDVVATSVGWETEHLISLDGTVVLTRNKNGKVKLHQSAKLGGRRSRRARWRSP